MRCTARSTSTVVLVTVLLTVFVGLQARAKGPAYTDPQHVDEDFAVQGEYTGLIDIGEEDLEIGVQIVAQGNGKFELARFVGGLPGAGWNGEAMSRLEATRAEDGTVTFVSEQARGIWRDGVVEVHLDGQLIGKLKKVERESPTLGKRPPEGAEVLFDGSSVENWKNGKMEDGLLVQGTTSRAEFQSHKLHIEFRLPYQPEDRGQARGNSGLYLQGRYEVQMLDSFGLEGKDNECGGIYTIRAPSVNMCLPPLSWQTYDVDFVAAEFDADGNMAKKPKITVRHNGVLIHKDVELPKSTTAAPNKPGPEPGPVYLQNHGNPVRYRNIWVVRTSD